MKHLLHLKRSVNGTTQEDMKVRTDDVNEPAHYTVGGMEAIEVIRAKLTPEEFIGWLKGNVLKYYMRANYKGKHKQDLAKGNWYSQYLGTVVEGGE
jgi:hypothetical protein